MPAIRSARRDARGQRSLNTRPMPSLVDEEDEVEYFSYQQISGSELGRPLKSAYMKNTDPEFINSPGPDIPRPTNPRPPPLTLKDFECIKTLGRSHCQVLLVRSKRKAHYLDNDILYALKAIPRRTFRTQAVEIANAYAHTKGISEEKLEYLVKEHLREKDTERSHLVQLSWHPFVAGLVQTFHDSQNLYMGLEYMPGGTLRALLQKARGGMKPRDALFYFANLVSAVEHLHDLQIVHRDLKPENIMLNSDGYLCLTDFGSSSKNDEFERQWKDMDGTPCYTAPECSAESPYYPQNTPEALDWWSCGCILFEMATGKMAFYAEHPELVRERTALPLQWPPGIKVGKNLKNLIEELVIIEPSTRLGTASGAQEVQSHPWLSGIHWGKMSNRQYLPPFLPKAVNVSELWHSNSLPDQRTVPGIVIIEPPAHLAHDDRFPTRW